MYASPQLSEKCTTCELACLWALMYLGTKDFVKLIDRDVYAGGDMVLKVKKKYLTKTLHWACEPL